MYIFLTDPWNTLDHANDTTLRILTELNSLIVSKSSFQKRRSSTNKTNHKISCSVFWSTVPHFLKLSLSGRNRFEHGGKRTGISPELWKIENQNGKYFRKKTHINFDLADIQQVHYRLDPPLDEHYRWGLEQLQLLTSRVVNPAEVLLSKSEKLIPFELSHPRPGATSFAPETLVSKNIVELEASIHRWKKAVFKPLFGAQSIGVEILSHSNPKKLKSRLSTLTQNERKSILIQKFLPDIYNGEIRLWFIDGHLLATAKKIPKQTLDQKKRGYLGNPIINMDQGGSLSKTADYEIEQIKPLIQSVSNWLGSHKIRLAAVDVIDQYVTDFNITSPGLIVQMEKLLNLNLAKEIAKKLISPIF